MATVDDRVVFWDFDGTLASRPDMWSGCLVEALDEISPGHELAPDDLRPGLRNGFPWHRPDLGHEYLRTAEDWWRAHRPLFVRAYRKAGINAVTATAAASQVSRLYYLPERWSVDPQARSALERVRSACWTSIVVSNHGPELSELVTALGLGDVIGDVITSAEVGFEKPHATIYRHALSRAGSPTTRWMIGDNPVADVEGAQAAGIPAILVHNRHAGEPIDLRQAVNRILTNPSP